MTSDADLQDTAAAEPMRAAAEPRGVSGAVLWGMVWALLFAALGLVAVREAFLHWGLFGGRPELPLLVGLLDGRRFEPWMAGAGGVLVLLGLLLAVAGLRRRPRRTYRLDAHTGVYLRFGEAARLAELTAGEVPGVLTSRARPGRSQLRVTLATTGATGTEEEVRQLLTARLAALAHPPTVKVKAIATGRRSQNRPPGPGAARFEKEDRA